MVKTKSKLPKLKHYKLNLPKKISTLQPSRAKKPSSKNCKTSWSSPSAPKTSPTNTKSKPSNWMMKSSSSNQILSIYKENPFSQAQSPPKWSKRCWADQMKSHRCSWKLKGSRKRCSISRGHWKSCRMSLGNKKSNQNNTQTGLKTKLT